MKRPMILALCAFALGGTAACSVDLDDYVFDDDAFEDAQNMGGASTGGDTATGGDTTTGGDNGTGADAGTGGDTQAPTICESFCTDSAETCPFGESFSYESEEECLTLCDTYTDTELECRIVHLGFAENGPEEHCPHTLLDGGGQCPDATPDPCDDFCEDSAEICPFGQSFTYASEEECLLECSKYTDTQLECRIVHLGFAESGPEQHCPHTLVDGGGQCPDATMNPAE